MRTTRSLMAAMALVAGSTIVFVARSFAVVADDYAALPTASADNGKPANATVHRESASVARTRYRRLYGKWWYWLPSNEWARWDGHQWTIPASTATRFQKWRR